MREFKNMRNPLLPLDIHIPDSEARVMPDGKLYIYGSCDKRADVYCSESYYVVSTPDMENWTIHDEALNGNDIPWFRDPDAPKYPGIDWEHPTPFIRRMLEEMEGGQEAKEAFDKTTGKSPMGPFTYRGIIIDNADCDPASWNNHGSIQCVSGQWYVFYHRCSRGVKEYRRLCVEPVTIRPDGSIDEVKMTSQGAGAPFAPGETIMGYQACGLKGKVYIGTDRGCGEKLTNIASGDEAVFRYVRSEEDYRRAGVEARGSGKITLYMNGKEAGSVTISDGKQTGEKLECPAGEYELTLRFEEAEGLEIISVTLW